MSQFEGETKLVNFRLPVKFAKQLARMAKDKRVSMTSIVYNAVRKEIAKWEQDN